MTGRARSVNLSNISAPPGRRLNLSNISAPLVAAEPVMATPFLRVCAGRPDALTPSARPGPGCRLAHRTGTAGRHATQTAAGRGTAAAGSREEADGQEPGAGRCPPGTDGRAPRAAGC